MFYIGHFFIHNVVMSDSLLGECMPDVLSVLDYVIDTHSHSLFTFLSFSCHRPLLLLFFMCYLVLLTNLS